MTERRAGGDIRIASVLEGDGLLSRRQALMAAGAGLAGMVLAGCSSETGAGKGAGGAAAADLSGKPIEKTLQLYNWTDYDDPKTLKLYSKRHDVKIVQSYFQSNDELVAKMEAGGADYDVIAPSQSVIPRLIEGKHVQPLDHQLIPNLKYLAPEFQNVDYDRGNKYSVTKDWGITGFYWRKDVIPPSEYPKTLLEAWKMLPKYKGKRINFMEGGSEVMPLAFHALGLDGNTENEDDYKKVYELLKEVWPAITTFNSTFVDKIGAGSIDIGLGWNGDVAQGMLQAAKRGIEYHFMVPQGRGEYWTDNWLIPAKAPHPVAAHKFIDFMLDPKIAAREMDYIQYGTPVPEALKYVSREVRENPIVAIPSSVLSGYTAGMDTPKTVALTTKYWNLLKS
jgi:spermidine/putrescine transport system substrate-binding protein